MKKKVLQMLLICVFGLVTSNVFAQTSVSGVVQSDTGETLPGVSIAVKGTFAE